MLFGIGVCVCVGVHGVFVVRGGYVSVSFGTGVRVGVHGVFVETALLIDIGGVVRLAPG